MIVLSFGFLLLSVWMNFWFDKIVICLCWSIVLSGSLMRIVVDDVKNFVIENVMGDIWLLIMNCVWSISGVDSVKSGCIRECRMVGIKRSGE